MISAGLLWLPPPATNEDAPASGPNVGLGVCIGFVEGFRLLLILNPLLIDIGNNLASAPPLVS